MVVLLASEIGGLNGAAVAGANMAWALAETQREVAVVSSSVSSDLRTRLGPRVQFLELRVGGPRVGAAGWGRWLRSWEQGRRVARLDPRLTVVNDMKDDLLKVSGLRGRGRRVVVNHGSVACYTDRVRYPWGSLDEAVGIMEKYDGLVFVSERCRAEWLALGDLGRKRSFCIPNCCREEEAKRILSQPRAEVRRRLGLSPGAFVAVCVASIQYRKGQDLLLSSLGALRQVVPDLWLYLVGPVGQTKGGAEILRMMDRLPLSECVRVTGPRPDALEFIYAADVLVLPSRAEAQGIVILEAMALGTPIIAADVDGIPEMIEHNVTGLLFSPGDPAALVQAFERVASDTTSRRSRAEAASERYWSRFSRARYAEQWRDLCRVMIQEEA